MPTTPIVYGRSGRGREVHIVAADGRTTLCGLAKTATVPNRFGNDLCSCRRCGRAA